jgi:hypothetical protein
MAKKTQWWHTYEAEGTLWPGGLDYVVLEQKASIIRHISMLLVPGLLQTEQYAEAVLSRWPTLRSLKTGEPNAKVIQYRLDRQWHLFERDDKPHMQVIIGEAALLQIVGDTQVMRGQIIHLLEMSKLPHVNLQILPLRSPLSSLSALGAISASILSFASKQEPEVIAIEDSFGSMRNTDNVQEVQTAKLEFLDLQHEALSVTRSRTYLTNLADELLDDKKTRK